MVGKGRKRIFKTMYLLCIFEKCSVGGFKRYHLLDKQFGGDDRFIESQDGFNDLGHVW